jgi:hypothetical protein
VFNGSDSLDVEFGGDEDLTAACSIFAQYGASLYNMNLFFKNNETWALVGSGPNDWVRYQMSALEGCPAPFTLSTFHLPVETHTGLNRNVAIWQGNNGIYISDGRSPVPIHHDVRKYFDPSNVDCMNSAYIPLSRGFLDRKNYEWHWIFYSGAGATLTELVFDYRRWKWYKTDRGTSNQLLCGIMPVDSNQETYCYAANGGYMVRINNGTQFVGVATNNIVQTLRIGDIPQADNDPFMETMIRHILVASVAKATTANSITMTHYSDTATAPDGTWTMSPKSTGKRVAINIKNANTPPALLHSIQLTLTTSDEAQGLEPLYLGLASRPVKERTTAT